MLAKFPNHSVLYYWDDEGLQMGLVLYTTEDFLYVGTEGSTAELSYTDHDLNDALFSWTRAGAVRKYIERLTKIRARMEKEFRRSVSAMNDKIAELERAEAELE